MSHAQQTSTGHDLSGGAWLDVHYQSAKVEYEEGLRWVGVQPGWQVLDAGCGGGGFLPLLCELVGRDGRVTAMDLAPENIARVDGLAAANPTMMSLTTKVGSLGELPFPDRTFDCVWTANVLQYLTEPEVDRALLEFRRVLKPGGKLAVKEFDASLIGLFPLDQGLVARWQAARQARFAARGVFGAFHSQTIPARLRAAGLTDVRARSWLVEHRAPLSAPGRACLGGRGSHPMAGIRGRGRSRSRRSRLLRPRGVHRCSRHRSKGRVKRDLRKS